MVILDKAWRTESLENVPVNAQQYGCTSRWFFDSKLFYIFLLKSPSLIHCIQ
ncbi:UNVERIFIED_CONTAM: hypothetical protein FKN15_038365 [Acipenser sinensis]